MSTFLLQLKGKSGKRYSLSFECEDFIDVETMLRDCTVDGDVDGILQETIEWEDMPEQRSIQ
jgi:hypothetical protein